MEKQILYKVEIQGNESALSEIAKLRKSNADLKSANEDYNKSLREGKTVSDDMAKAYERNNAQMKANNKSISTLTKEVTSNGNEQVNLRKKLTDVRREMQQMAAAGDTQSKQYRELRTEAASYQDSLDRVNKEIKTFADDAMVLNTVVDSAKGLASGMELVQSATALAGVESEDLMEVLVKLKAIQGVVNGLQGVSNMLQKDSRTILIAKIGAQKAATAAQWLWNKAMLANPIGIIVGLVATLGAGIYALVKNFDDVTEAIKQAWEWLQFWKSSSDEAVEANDALTASNQRSEKSFRDKASATEFEIKLLKAMGAEQDDIIEKERALLELRALQLEQIAFITEASLDATQEEKERAREAADNAENELKLFEVTQQRRLKLEKERITNSAIQRQEAERKQAEDELRRAELAAAELTFLLEESLDNRINVEEVKFRQLLETKRNLTEEEIALLQHKHERQLEELRLQYEQEEELAEEFGDTDEARQEEINVYAEYLEQRRQSELSDFEKRREQYDAWLQSKSISDIEYAHLVKQLNNEIAESDRQLAEERANAALSTTRSLIDSMVQAGDAASGFAEFAKMLAIAETSMNIILGISKTASVGFPQNIPLLLGYATQTAGLVGQIKKLKTPDTPKMAKGGTGMIIDGKPHSQGGIPIMRGDTGEQIAEIEGKEYFAVVNKYDAERAALLDGVNQRHGVSFGSSHGSYFAKGGTSMPLPRKDFKDTDIESIIRQTVETVGSIPVVVSERDIRETSRRVQVLENAGDL